MVLEFNAKCRHVEVVKRAYCCFIAVLAISLQTVVAQTAQARQTNAVGIALALSAEDGYAALAHAGLSTSWTLIAGTSWGVALRTAGLYLAPSAWAAEGYRYRGFMAGSLLGGAYLPVGPLRLTVLTGAGLARYALSDSWFFYPVLQADALVDFARFSRSTFGLSASCMLLFRPDAFTFGLGLSLCYSLDAEDTQP